MDSIFNKVWRFMLSNLASVGIYFCLVLLVGLFYNSLFDNWSDNKTFNVITYGFVMIGFPFLYYFIYFFKNDEYKRKFISHTVGKEWSIKEELKCHFHTFGKQELAILLAFYVVLAFVPNLWLGKIGLGFAFFSISLFYEVIPIQPLAALIWVVYICVVYVICLSFAYRKWDKERLRKDI